MNEEEDEGWMISCCLLSLSILYIDFWILYVCIYVHLPVMLV